MSGWAGGSTGAPSPPPSGRNPAAESKTKNNIKKNKQRTEIEHFQTLQLLTPLISPEKEAKTPFNLPSSARKRINYFILKIIYGFWRKSVFT